jgi:hypothetical protein
MRAAFLAMCLLTPAAAQTPPMTPAQLVRLLPAEQPEQPDMVLQDYPLVHRVDCFEGRGSAFRVGKNHWMSAAHVTRLHFCSVALSPLTVTYQDETADFAEFDTPLGVPNGFPIDCGGFKPGHWYWAIGYPNGGVQQIAIALYATIYRHDGDGFRIFVSPHDVIPGMSGGPILDPDTGAVVGTVNANNDEYNLSFSRELKDTVACKGSVA